MKGPRSLRALVRALPGSVLALLLLALLAGPIAIRAEEEPEEDLASRDPAELDITDQKARVAEILHNGGFRGDTSLPIEHAELNAAFLIVEAVKGKGVAWAAVMTEDQGLAREVESLTTAKIVKGLTFVAYDADEDGTVYATAKFRAVKLLRRMIPEKDWKRLEIRLREVEEKYTKDITVTGIATTGEKPETAAAPKKEAGAGPQPDDWIRMWRKAKKAMGPEYTPEQKLQALEVAKLRAQRDLILVVKGWMDLERNQYISEYVKYEDLKQAFTIGHIQGVQFVKIRGVRGGNVFVKAKIRLTEFVRSVRTVNNMKTLTREQVTVLEEKDRVVEATGQASCNPRVIQRPEPEWIPVGEVK